MTDSKKEIKVPKIYQITGLIAFIHSAILIVLSIYNQFFYVDGTWAHGFIANGFAILSGLIWIGILFVFKRFLNEILNYSKSNSLLNAYLIFLAINFISLVTIVFNAFKLYLSFEEGDGFNSMSAFATTSIKGAVLIFTSNFAIILICILLGNRIRKIDVVEKKLFQILGFSFIGYGIVSFLVTVIIIESNTSQFLVEAGLAIVIGLILKKVSSMDYSKLYSILSFTKVHISEQSKPKIKEKVFQKEQTEKKTKFYPKKNIVTKEKKKETNLAKEEIPNINIDELENKEIILDYYVKLSKEELNRLENIVAKKYGLNLTNEQKSDLVKHYIAEKKIYDHQRFFPK